MEDLKGVDVSDDSRPAGNSQAPHPRAVGAPLPRGGARPPAYSAIPETPVAPRPPVRSLAAPAVRADPDGHSPHSSNMQRAVSALRAAVPFVQRLLPLLDGNVVTAVSNVLAPHPKAAPALNLAPLQDGLTALQLQQRELGDQVAEQRSSLQRVEDQLQMVREATDRNTLEQQELLEDLKGIGHKVNIVALAALALLLISVLVNVFLYLHIERILP